MSKRVLTLGEPMVMFVANQIGPLEDVNHFTRFVAGAELNVAIGLQRLGHNVTYVTRLGRDPFGRHIFQVLQETRVNTDEVTFDDRYHTGFQLKSKVLTGDPEVVYYRKNSAASHLSSEDIEKIDLSSVDHIHITGIPLALSKESRDATFFLIKRARAANIRISFDPNLRPSLWVDEKTMVTTVNEAAAHCDIVLPGVEEGKMLTGSSQEVEIGKFYHALGIETVVVKLGSKGAYVNEGFQSYYVHGFKVDTVVDTVGAGDGFAVGVISGVLDGMPIREAVRQGNAIGALQVMVPGDNEGLPSRPILDNYLKDPSRGGESL